MADPRTLRLPVLTATWRLTAAILLAVAAVNLPFSLVAVLLMTDPPVTPAVLVRSLLVFSVLPGGAAGAILRLFRADVRARGHVLTLDRPGLEAAVPAGAVRRIEPWRLPLPTCGFAVRLSSGERLPYRICATAPDALLDLLGEAGADVSAARAHPTVVWARERARRARSGVRRLLLKFVAFAALPTAILFNAHQYIAYGGTFGQYYLHGPGAYLQTLALYWSMTAIYLVLYASLLRGLAELAAFPATWLSPARAGRVRQAADATCSVLYYGGVPLLLLYRFLP
jgi:hypothetical protein